jgi:gliding motility-associated lipoprotein GldH
MLRTFSSFLILIFISSCSNSEYFSANKTTPGYWHKDSLVEFSFKVKDTVQNFNCYINIRNTEDYQFDNLFLITAMQFPYGKVVVDTLEYKMALKDGKLMGQGIGNLKYNKLWYKEDVPFSEPGEYNLKIRHAMRKAGQIDPLEKLEGIEEVGFSYEPITPEKP